MDKQTDLKKKAITIKGKKYILVSDRVLYFNAHYPYGFIRTELVSNPESDNVIVKATVYPNDEVDGLKKDNIGYSSTRREFTGYSQATKGDGLVNRTAALENAETSAVGRALAMMGIGVLDSIASSDEINKSSSTPSAPKPASQKQLEWIRKEISKHFQQNPDSWVLEHWNIPIDKIPSIKVMDAIETIRSLAVQAQRATPENIDEIVENYPPSDVVREETVREKAARKYIRHEVDPNE